MSYKQIQSLRDLKVQEKNETLKTTGNSQRLIDYRAKDILELLVLKLHKMTGSEGKFVLIIQRMFTL